MFYHINCGVIQGFPALRIAVTTHVKRYRIFSRVDIANQLLTRHSSLAPLDQVDEWTANPSRFLMQVVCLENPRIVAAKTLRNTYCWQTLRFKLFQKGKKTNILKEKPDGTLISGFGVSISLGWEWKLTTRRFITGWFWPFTWNTSVGKKKVIKWEFFKLKITTIVSFVIMIQRIFPVVSANALYDCYSGIVNSFIFIH